VIRLSFRGSMLFCIEKPRGLVTTPFILLNLLICGGVGAFALYIVYFAFFLHFLHTHLNHLASHVILACICLIMPITVLG
jgi:hypothetical protein